MCRYYLPLEVAWILRGIVIQEQKAVEDPNNSWLWNGRNRIFQLKRMPFHFKPQSRWTTLHRNDSFFLLKHVPYVPLSRPNPDANPEDSSAGSRYLRLTLQGLLSLLRLGNSSTRTQIPFQWDKQPTQNPYRDPQALIRVLALIIKKSSRWERQHLTSFIWSSKGRSGLFFCNGQTPAISTRSSVSTPNLPEIMHRLPKLLPMPLPFPHLHSLRVSHQQWGKNKCFRKKLVPVALDLNLPELMLSM